MTASNCGMMVRLGFWAVLFLALGTQTGTAFAQDPAPTTQPSVMSLPDPNEVLGLIDKATSSEPGQANDWSAPVKLAVVFALLALLPSVLVMMTSFTRIVIVLSFVRRALTTQNIPPTIALIGLALFLTLYTMAPTFSQINQQALQPYLDNQMPFPDACAKAMVPMKEFMSRQTRPADLEMFVELSGIEPPTSAANVPSHVMIPAFAISEFRKAFEMGCLLFIPFLLVDLVVSGILLSAGMMMLPPVIISLPFKIILFVLVDGWRLLARTLVTSFH